MRYCAYSIRFLRFRLTWSQRWDTCKALFSHKVKLTGKLGLTHHILQLTKISFRKLVKLTICWRYLNLRGYWVILKWETHKNQLEPASYGIGIYDALVFSHCQESISIQQRRSPSAHSVVYTMYCKNLYTCAVLGALLLVLAPIHRVNGEEEGAPPEACATMTP
jgi:hypothetical protein